MMCAMRIPLSCAVEGRDQFAGTVIAVAVDPAVWELHGVLVEPAHRVGLGKWVPPDLIRADNSGGLQMQIAADQFAGLDDAESSTLEEGVRSSYVIPFPYTPRGPDPVQRVVTQTTPPGNTVLSASTPVLGLDWDHVAFGGVTTSGQNQIQGLLLLRQRFIGRSEHDVPTSKVTLTDRGIEVDG